MRLERLNNFILSLPQTTLVRQWGECLVFKVAGKMFCLVSLDGVIMNGIVFKCLPEDFDKLIQIEGIGQAPYCAKRMWVRVEDFGAISETELYERIRASYRLVTAKLPKKTRVALGL